MPKIFISCLGILDVMLYTVNFLEIFKIRRIMSHYFLLCKILPAPPGFFKWSLLILSVSLSYRL